MENIEQKVTVTEINSLEDLNGRFDIAGKYLDIKKLSRMKHGKQKMKC